VEERGGRGSDETAQGSLASTLLCKGGGRVVACVVVVLGVRGGGGVVQPFLLHVS